MANPQVAVVTGASGGIGKAVVHELLRMNYQVHAIALADEYLAALNDLHGVYTHGVDVRDHQAVSGVVADLQAEVLVNNAGTIGRMVSAQQYDPAVANDLIDINLRSAVQTTLAVLPGMVERDRGHIFFTGSIAATRPTANTAVYSATKAALAAFADGLRLDLFGSAIRVTVLAPGRVQTNLYDEALGSHDAAVSKLYSGALAIQPHELATLVGVVLGMPAHVDVTRLEVIPTGQVYGGSQI